MVTSKTPEAARDLAYDVGMNNGDDTAYYLAKGFRVVAVEADPALVATARTRFAHEIAEGRLTLLDVAVARAAGRLTFHVNNRQPVLNTLYPPAVSADSWTQVEVEARTLSSIVAEAGLPAFMKVDVEGADGEVLEDLLYAQIRPPMISVEVHGFRPAAILAAMGYDEFRMVNGAQIGGGVARRNIHRLDGTRMDFDFRHHSSGPFGDDLEAAWCNLDELPALYSDRLARLGPGSYNVNGRRNNRSIDK